MSDELGLPRALVTHLPNGVDLNRFRPPTPEQRTAARQMLAITPQEWAVGVVGSLTPVKGHDMLLAAMALARQAAPNIRLFIVGDGPIRAALEAQAEHLALSDCVRFIGQREDVPIVLHALDAYVCPSHSEGTSNALLEAMASGLPVVSTVVGDHPVIIREGADGLITPPGEAVAMAHALQSWCSSPQLACDMGIKARARAAQFSFDGTVESYQRYYHDLCPRSFTHAHLGARSCRGMSKSVFGASFSRVGARPPLQ
jgi:glycosyltransferase involved in cell wall biosynthesis